MVLGLQVETVVESAVQAASKGLVSELLCDLSLGLEIVLELEFFPLSKSWIYDYSHFVYVRWVY